MGNHEQMVFRGDLRYVNERYQVSRFTQTHYDALYNKDTESANGFAANTP